MADSVAVVIASVREEEVLEACLRSVAPLAARRGARLVVGRADASRAVASRWPDVAFVWLPPGSSIPRVRGAGILEANAEAVALTEDHCVADDQWLDALLAARDGALDAQVVGGVMETTRTQRAIDLGAYFAEYGFFGSAPTRLGERPLITGANVLYCGAIVAAVGTAMARGDWENVVHDRLRAGSVPMSRTPQAVTRQNLSYRVGPFLRDRWEHGFDFARTRLQEAGSGNFPRRIGLVAGSLLLPGLLAARVYRATGTAHRRSFWRALPWTLAFLAAWSAGECAGYLRGPVHRIVPVEGSSPPAVSRPTPVEESSRPAPHRPPVKGSSRSPPGRSGGGSR